MIKHVVMFRLKEAECADLAGKCAEIKKRLSALVGQVPTLLTAEVGVNCNPKEAFHIVLTTTHNDMEGLREYAEHPLHVAVSKEVIRPVLESRSCVDFEF